jgi:ABC-2 type transport system ATP-binding protein
MIAIEELTRCYGSHTAVNHVSLSIERGEVVGLLGHNGAGKTTLMKMMTGHLAPTGGRVVIDGLDVATSRQAAQRRIGYLPEMAPTYPEMLVQDYLLMVAELRGVPAPRRKQAVVEAARDTELLDRLTSPIHTLSKGYRQRVGLAQAIVHAPELLILDEPTNGLDPTQIQSMRRLIRRVGERSTVLLSTHILQEIEAVCSRVLVMIGGELVADAPLSELTGAGGVALSVRAPADEVAEALRALPGVTRAARVGEDPTLEGYDRWRVDAPATGEVVEAVVGACRERGWQLGSVGPHVRTLEQAFADLEAAHVERRKEAA